MGLSMKMAIEDCALILAGFALLWPGVFPSGSPSARNFARSMRAFAASLGVYGILGILTIVTWREGNPLLGMRVSLIVAKHVFGGIALGIIASVTLSGGWTVYFRHFKSRNR